MDQETNVAEPKEVIQEKTNAETATPEDLEILSNVVYERSSISLIFRQFVLDL